MPDKITYNAATLHRLKMDRINELWRKIAELEEETRKVEKELQELEVDLGSRPARDRQMP